MSDDLVDGGSDGDGDEAFALTVGHRLRAIRTQQGLSLHAVERKSGGRWKGVVIGSYERGTRAITIQRLAELADFYAVPISELLPDGGATGGPAAEATRLVVDLEKLAALPAERAAPLARYVASLQRQRGDYNGRVLTIRQGDLRNLALIYDETPGELAAELVELGVLSTDRRGR